MTNTPSDRVQVRQLGSLMHPAACALCGNGTCDRGYVDLDIYYDYEGQVYLCMLCTEEVVETIGGLLPDQALHLKEVGEQIANKNRELEEENADLRSKLNSWDSVITDALNRSVLSGTVESSEPTGTEPSSESADGAGGGESGTTESTPKRRPNDATRPKQRNRAVL